jgi:hypothetical protein
MYGKLKAYINVPSVNNYWFAPSLTEKTFILRYTPNYYTLYLIHFLSNPPNWTTQVVNVWDMANRYEECCRALAAKLSHDTDPHALDEDLDWRYLMDNRASMFSGFDLGVQVYKEVMLGKGSLLQQVLYILLPVSFCVLAGLIIVLFLPALKKIKQERSDTRKFIQTICLIF